MSLYLWLALGGAIGTLARFGISGLVAQHFGNAFPWGTLVINVTGSFLIGFIATFTDADGRFTLNSTARYFVMTGVLGGFTTFSAFSRETALMIERRDFALAAGYVAASVIVCGAALFVGLMLMRRLAA